MPDSSNGTRAPRRPSRAGSCPRSRACGAWRWLAVVAYHLQLGWASGGYLGVDLFFVLSGFLITTLLLEEWVGARRINLVAFWGRRARRLLPALFLVLAALALYVVLNARFGGPGANGLLDLAGLRGDALATLLYVNNWHLIYAHQSYFAQFSTPSPLQHTWSLAIEEQFYLVWPPVLLLPPARDAQWWRARRSRPRRGARTGIHHRHGGAFSSRGSIRRAVYYGTDTRLFDLMAGADPRLRGRVEAPARSSGPGARCTSPVPSPGVALVVFWVTAGTPAGLPKDYMFDGGFLVCAVLAAARRCRCTPRPAGFVLPSPRRAPASVRRDDLLWRLPVALAGHRLSQRCAHRPGARAARPGPNRGHARVVDRELLPGGAAHPTGPFPRVGPGLGRAARRAC